MNILLGFGIRCVRYLCMVIETWLLASKFSNQKLVGTFTKWKHTKEKYFSFFLNQDLCFGYSTFICPNFYNSNTCHLYVELDRSLIDSFHFDGPVLFILPWWYFFYSLLSHKISRVHVPVVSVLLPLIILVNSFTFHLSLIEL